MDMQEVAYRYVAERNPEGGFLPGVPLRDLTRADLARMPSWLRESLTTCPFYEAVGVSRRGSARPTEVKED